mgnify:CR=1 FL=1
MTNSYTAKQKAYLKQIGRNIRKFRKEKGIYQEELAFKANLDRSYIGGVERGERNVSALNIKKVAEALKISPKELI